MSRQDVRAVVLPALDGRSTGPTVSALEAQTRAPSQVGVGLDSVPGSLEPGWLWLVEGAVVPEPDALEHLLQAARALEPLGPPALLAGKVVVPGGSPDRLALPIPAVSDPELTLGAFERGVLALRAARRGSLLVRGESFARAGLRTTDRDDMLWTARLLRGEPGYLVPASVAVRAPGSPRGERKRARAALADWLRLVLSDALEPGEKPWFAFRLVEEALAAARR